MAYKWFILAFKGLYWPVKGYMSLYIYIYIDPLEDKYKPLLG